jgi:hypothetical protein
LLLYSSYLPLGISQLAGHLLHHHRTIYSNHRAFSIVPPPARALDGSQPARRRSLVHFRYSRRAPRAASSSEEMRPMLSVRTAGRINLQHAPRGSHRRQLRVLLPYPKPLLVSGADPIRSRIPGMQGDGLGVAQRWMCRTHRTVAPDRGALPGELGRRRALC